MLTYTKRNHLKMWSAPPRQMKKKVKQMMKVIKKPRQTSRKFTADTSLQRRAA